MAAIENVLVRPGGRGGLLLDGGRGFLDGGRGFLDGGRGRRSGLGARERLPAHLAEPHAGIVHRAAVGADGTIVGDGRRGRSRRRGEPVAALLAELRVLDVDLATAGTGGHEGDASLGQRFTTFGGLSKREAL